MKCTKCGFEDDGKFCSNCGSELPLLPVQGSNMAANNTPGEWQVFISFGKSSSANFDRALYLAKAAPRYLETVDEVGKIVFQAFYGKNEYLQFVALYELIGSWKSCFVFINNELVDRKIIGNINYCYGDNLRSGNPKFCFGASQWTENPFGCHRAQIHQGGKPWYTFGTIDTTGIFHVDVEEIVMQLQIRLTPYRYCPALDLAGILEIASRLPRTINPKRDKGWEYGTHYYADGSSSLGIRPTAHAIGYEMQLPIEAIDAGKGSKVINSGKDSGPKLPGIFSRLFGK